MPDPQSFQGIGWLMVAFFALAGGVNQVLRLFSHLKEKPPPAETYATKVEMSGLRADVKGLSVELQVQCEKLSLEGERREDRIRRDIIGVHHRVDRILEAGSSNKGT